MFSDPNRLYDVVTGVKIPGLEDSVIKSKRQYGSTHMADPGFDIVHYRLSITEIAKHITPIRQHYITRPMDFGAKTAITSVEVKFAFSPQNVDSLYVDFFRDLVELGAYLPTFIDLNFMNSSTPSILEQFEKIPTKHRQFAFEHLMSSPVDTFRRLRISQKWHDNLTDLNNLGIEVDKFVEYRQVIFVKMMYEDLLDEQIPDAPNSRVGGYRWVWQTPDNELLFKLAHVHLVPHGRIRTEIPLGENRFIFYFGKETD